MKRGPRERGVLTAINTSFSVDTPTGRHPFVAFCCCLALPVGRVWDDLL